MSGPDFNPTEWSEDFNTGRTGPPYPPEPGADSNGIGDFVVNESSVGTIAPFNWRETILSQYANSPIITRLIENIFDAIDQTANFEAFYDHIWNIATATGYGLDVWGRIVGVTRTLTVNVGHYFGFSQAQPFTVGFGGAPFFMGEAQETITFVIQDETYRLLIMAKAASNITNGSVPAINRILMALFPSRGNAYVTDGHKNVPYFGFSQSISAKGFGGAPFYMGQPIPRMQIEYVFNFQLTPLELAIVEQSGVLPKPVGVATTVKII